MRDYLVQLSKKKVSVSLVFDCCFSGHMYRGPEFDKTDFKRTKSREVIGAHAYTFLLIFFVSFTDLVANALYLTVEIQSFLFDN